MDHEVGQPDLLDAANKPQWERHAKGKGRGGEGEGRGGGGGVGEAGEGGGKMGLGR